MAVKNSYVDSPGQPTINHDLCTYCKMCIEICASNTLVEGDGKVAIDLDTLFGCVACLQCVAVCGSDAITVSGRALEANDRVQLPPLSERASAEQLNSLLLARRSIRRFSDREVERDVLDRVLEMASTAPMGAPPSDVHAIVFHGRDKVHAFASDVVDFHRKALPVMKKFVSPIGKLFMPRTTVEMFETFLIPMAQFFINDWDRGRDSLFHDAPAAIYFHATPWVDEVDVGVVATYAMLAAESLGLGNCMIGSVHPFLIRSKKLCKKYGIPKENKNGIVLILGHPRMKFKHAIRRRLGSVRDYQQPVSA